MTDVSRYEQLPELPERSARSSKDKSANDSEFPDGDEELTIEAEPDKPLNQWKLLKLIEAEGTRGLALADLCARFQIEDRDDERLLVPLGQLLRARRIKECVGVGRRGTCGRIYVSTREPQNESED